jgi:hypothetical protein
MNTQQNQNSPSNDRKKGLADESLIVTEEDLVSNSSYPTFLASKTQAENALKCIPG